MRMTSKVAPLFCPGLLLAAAGISALAHGVVHPDLSVSPYAAGFFGVGTAPGAETSNVVGVAAQAGVFRGAVGSVQFPFNGVRRSIPVLYLPGGGITLLGDLNRNGNARAISNDGTIKAGSCGGLGSAVYWDVNNNRYPLPFGGGDTSALAALAVSPDGQKIAGYVGFEDADGNHSEGAIWTPGGTGLSRLGIPAGFQSSAATAISGNGYFTGGFVTRLDNSFNPPVTRMRAFIKSEFSTLQVLPTLGGNVDSIGYGLDEDGSMLVG